MDMETSLEWADYNISWYTRPGNGNTKQADECPADPIMAPDEEDELVIVLPDLCLPPGTHRSKAYVATRTKPGEYDLRLDTSRKGTDDSRNVLKRFGRRSPKRSKRSGTGGT